MDAHMLRIGCSILIALLAVACSLEATPTHQLQWRPVAGEIPTSQPAPDPEPHP